MSVNQSTFTVRSANASSQTAFGVALISKMREELGCGEQDFVILTHPSNVLELKRRLESPEYIVSPNLALVRIITDSRSPRYVETCVPSWRDPLCHFLDSIARISKNEGLINPFAGVLLRRLVTREPAFYRLDQN